MLSDLGRWFFWPRIIGYFGQGWASWWIYRYSQCESRKQWWKHFWWQRVRLEIVRFLLWKKDILLADEVMAALDEENGRTVRRLLHSFIYYGFGDYSSCWWGDFIPSYCWTKKKKIVKAKVDVTLVFWLFEKFVKIAYNRNSVKRERVKWWKLSQWIPPIKL